MTGLLLPAVHSIGLTDYAQCLQKFVQCFFSIFVREFIDEYSGLTIFYITAGFNQDLIFRTEHISFVVLLLCMK